MRPPLRKPFADGPILAVVMITLTAVLTHGLWIPWLGYYHDDWYMLWSAASRGVDSLVPLFSLDRPFMGFLYTIFYSIIRDNIFGWHVGALLFRVLGALAFYWILCLVWREPRRVFVLASMLFVAFPGFLAEPNAATKINHLAGYAAALGSVALTLKAARTGVMKWKVVWVLLSLASMAFYLWVYEYMIGLEVMRLALLYWVHWQGQRSQAVSAGRKVLHAYLPHIAVGAVFLFWRVFLFDSTRYATDLRGLAKDYYGDFGGMAVRLAFQVVKDFFSATLFSWFAQAHALLSRASYVEVLIALGSAALAVLLALAYLRFGRSADQEPGEPPAPFVLVVLGALIALAAVFPVVLSNRHLDLMDQYKAYGLHPSAGVIIMVIGIVLMLKPRFRYAALITLLAFSIGTQALNGLRWANFWDIQRNFWWQVSWRAPQLSDWTLVMAYIPDGYALQQDYEIWGPLNLIYRARPEHSPLIEADVLNRDTLLDVYRQTRSEPHVRDIYAPRDYGNLLLASQPTTASCVHVIDGKMPAYSASERAIVQQAGKYSSVDHIETGGAPLLPPPAVFGSEPERGWCYYYQQAALARQAGDWARVGSLYDEAQTKGLRPADASEYFPFIEGLVNGGRAADAQAIADRVVKGNAALQYSFCSSLAPNPKYPASFGYRWEEIQALVCGQAADK